MNHPVHRETVFIVDDDASVRDALALLLSLQGYPTALFACAEDFLRALAPQWRGVVIADIRMPGMSGLEMQEALAQHPARLPVIIVTGHGDLAAARQAFRWNAVDFIEKPFDHAQLLDAITRGLSGLPPDADRIGTRPVASVLSARERDVASPTFGVVPPSMDGPGVQLQPGETFVVSGGYRLSEAAPDGMTLVANERYWAGPPAIETVSIIHDIGGRSPVDAFGAGEIDYTGISSFDAAWIAYHPELGPQLREVASLSTDYYGFDAGEPPFDDVRVRQAFAAAVDWRRIARLAVSDPEAVATSMVPPGIPGRSDRDVVPPHDPDAARRLLAEAGYPDGRGFPIVTLLTGGSPYDEAVVVELERELGVLIAQEVMDFGDYFVRLDEDPPAMWNLSWVADYPGRNDFLGVLLGRNSTNNYGRWRSEEFDAAIADAGAATDPEIAAAAYDRAEAIVQRDAPVIPVTYGTGWALARDGLLGAGQNGLGSIRFGGLAWAD